MNGFASFDKWTNGLTLDEREELGPEMGNLIRAARACERPTDADEENDFPGDRPSKKGKG